MRSICLGDALVGFFAERDETLACSGKVALDHFDLVAERAFDRPPGLDQPVIGGDEDRFRLVDLPVERLHRPTVRSPSSRSPAPTSALCASCSCELMARATVWPVWPRCSMTAFDRASSAV